MTKIGEKMVIIILLVTIFLLVSCQPQEAKPAEISADSITEISIDGCTPQWECTEEYQVQVLENCTRINPTKCERGCVNGTCRPAGVCTTGFKCVDDFRRGYQKEDCSFISKKYCEWGCFEGKCQEKPTNIFENASEAPTPVPKYSAIAENQEDEEVEEKATVYILKVGEQQQIQINGVQTNVSIHFLEPSQVTIKVNGIKSNPILEQGNTTYENIGATFKIEWILFQSYTGGKQEIGYSVK